MAVTVWGTFPSLIQHIQDVSFSPGSTGAVKPRLLVMDCKMAFYICILLCGWGKTKMKTKQNKPQVEFVCSGGKKSPIILRPQANQPPEAPGRRQHEGRPNVGLGFESCTPSPDMGLCGRRRMKKLG